MSLEADLSLGFGCQWTSVTITFALLVDQQSPGSEKGSSIHFCYNSSPLFKHIVSLRFPCVTASNLFISIK